MSNYEELNNPAIEELNPEALEQAAGGAREHQKIRVTQDTYLRTGPGKNCPIVASVHSGKEFYYGGRTQADERGVNWYNVTDSFLSESHYAHYISSRCCKFI